MLVADPQVLAALGWNDYFAAQLPLAEQALARSGSTEAQVGQVARVVGVERTGLTVAPQGELSSDQVPVSGKWFRGDESTRPTIGDWVVVDTETGSLLQMLQRRSVIQRINPLGALQLIAANVDAALIVTSCNADFSPERLERYLSVVLEASIEPVLVLTKTDLTDQAGEFEAVLAERFPDVAKVSVNALNRDDVQALMPWCGPGQTLALLGSSGVGKSTLVNTLIGADVQLTAAIREEDAKGRHTTTNRTLHRLPSGGVILDSPGMRELQLAEAEEGLDQLFADVEALALSCRFNDCTHNSEPGCAVAAALASGDLDPERLQSYDSLRAEEARNRESLAQRRNRERAFGKKVRSSMLRKTKGRNGEDE
jgi:ribosome biogenesis GTPase